MDDQKTILLIDDEIDLQELVKIALKSRGHQVEVAGNGIEGLEKLETIKPDLIVLDMNMPKMGGLEFYQKICVNDQPMFPVLVLTARANMEQLFKEFNIDGFMAKPFDVEGLLREVETILDKRSGEGSKITSLGTRDVKNICVVENDQETLNQIGGVLLGAGYVVNPAQNGTEGIERIVHTLPDVALVKLGLVDISGDIVIGKLKRMAKTEDIRCILYTEKSGDKPNVVGKIGEKWGIDEFIEYTQVKELLEVVNSLLLS